MDSTAHGHSLDHPLMGGRKEESWAGTDDSHQDDLLSVFLAQLQHPQDTRKGVLAPGHHTAAQRSFQRFFSTLPYFQNWPMLCCVCFEIRNGPCRRSAHTMCKWQTDLRPEVSQLWPKNQIWFTACSSKKKFYWKTSKAIHLHTVYGSFCAKITELSCDRDLIWHLRGTTTTKKTSLIIENEKQRPW